MRISIRSPRSAASVPSPKRSVPSIAKLPPPPIFNLNGIVAMRSILAGPRSLRENGVHRFVENATIVCVGFQYGEQLLLWCPNGSQMAECADVKIHFGSTLPPEIHDAISSGAKFIAHNCELERAVLRKIGSPAIRIENWIDTSALARAWMLPVELNRLVTVLQIPTIPTDNLLPSSMTFTSVPDAQTLNNVLNSAITEVVAIGAVVARRQCLPDTSEAQTERRFFDKHVEINERGICIDLDLVTAASRIAEMELVQTDKKIQRITLGIINLSTLRNSNPDSASSLSAVLKQKYQFDLPASDEDTILEILGSPLLRVATIDNRQERRQKRVIKAILCARLRVASTGLGKLDSMLNQTSANGRLPGQYTYYGGHTGRSSSRGVQLQNLARPKEGVDVSRARAAILLYGRAIQERRPQDADDALQMLRNAAGPRGVPAAISACVATALIAPPDHTLIMADAAQIENRVLYWLAGDSANLELYRKFDAGTGKDPYCAAAEVLRGKPVAGKKENPSDEDKYWRKVGKVCEISLGYQMGVETFAKRCESEEIDLSKVDLTPKKCQEKWRQDHPKIAGPTGLWRVLEHGLEAVVKEGKARHLAVDGTAVTVAFKDGNLYIGLPSGRHLVYRNVRIAPSLKFPLKQQLTYDSAVGMSQLYGGLITENIVQAIAADCFRFWVLQAEQAGLKVIGHTHDEIIIEALERDSKSILRLIEGIMKMPPPWALSLPVNAEADSHAHYKK